MPAVLSSEACRRHPESEADLHGAPSNFKSTDKAVVVLQQHLLCILKQQDVVLRSCATQWQVFSQRRSWCGQTLAGA